MSKRTLDGFFTAASAKKPRLSQEISPQTSPVSTTPAKTTIHATYPWPLPHLPDRIADELESLVTAEGKVIDNQPDLDMLYYQPFIPHSIERALFEFLRSELFFYRVKYTIKRFGTETQINTPRYTTVFGLDDTSRFITEPPSIVEASEPSKSVAKTKYKCQPRPIPECLDFLRRVTEAATDTKYNFCLVNYYATGADSISFHSDDERFLGPDPAIASFSLGAKRDFLMKHKPFPPKDGVTTPETTPIKLPLTSGDMVLMRGRTQSNWLHSIPKRKGGDADKGRINITLRRAMVPYGTENYYQYNVGNGGVYKWCKIQKEMIPWTTTSI
jgi:alkylated DNA repair dioxygenase AlkB